MGMGRERRATHPGVVDSQDGAERLSGSSQDISLEIGPMVLLGSG